MLRVAFEVGKVFVCIVEEHFIVCDGPVVGQQRVINERSAFAAVLVHVIFVPDGFGGPYACHVGEVLALVLVREVHRTVLPVDEVPRFHEYHAAVACPAFGALHVGVDHVEPAVRCT